MTNVKTFFCADYGSEHQLLVATVEVLLKKIDKSKVAQNIMYSLHLNGFREDFDQKLEDIPNHTTDSDSKWKYFKNMIEETAQDNKRLKPIMKYLITNETAKMVFFKVYSFLF